MKKIRWAWAWAGLMVAGCAGSGVGGVGTAERGGALVADGEGGFCDGAAPDAEHACLHGQHGPFRTVTASPGSNAAGADVSEPHAAFTIGLPADGAGLHQGAVSYVPDESGDFAFFLGASLPLTILGPDGQPLAIEVDASVDPAECTALTHAYVAELVGGATYTLVFGPSASASALLVIEHAECHEECAAVELVASKSYGPPKWSDGVQVLEEPLHFRVPGELEVTEGDAGRFWSTLTYALGDEPAVTCWYQGDGGPHCTTPGAGAHYVLHHCSNEAQAGDDADADSFRLRVHHGGNAKPGQRTTVRVELEDPACHDHDGHRAASR
ncbi:MAG: hypothetical protein MUF34_38050 [Polyangiaceae bacterium]|jgi:hypothetical protein|nr:hypothetical protein [Polyangiaceae bacterium]